MGELYRWSTVFFTFIGFCHFDVRVQIMTVSHENVDTVRVVEKSS